MTPADEATFIELWQQGLITDAIAQRLGIKAGTARSRAYRGHGRDGAMRHNEDRNVLKTRI